MSNILHKGGALQEHLGRNLRERRRASGLTQDALARAAGISRRMLAAMETQGANASLLTVEKLAGALGTSFGDLVAAPAPPTPSVSPSAIMWQSEEGGFGALLAAVRASSAVEFWECKLASGEQHEGMADPPGSSELIYVLQGEIHLHIGQAMRRIPARASTVFGTEHPYLIVNATSEDAVFFRVLVT